MHIKVSTLPRHLQAKLSQVGYHRPDIAIEARETVSIQDFGGDGRRAFFFPFSLDASKGCGEVVYGSWGGPNPFETRQPDADNRDHAIPVGCGVVKGSDGGPGRMHATLYVHPATIAPLLPAMPVITERQGAILRMWAQLTSAGRKYEFERNPKLRPTEAELVDLVGLGLLSRNRAGAVAITTEGRNACPRGQV